VSESPDFLTLSRIEEDLLIARLQAIRKSITHAPEKGRALEHAVRALLRDFLPSQYGLSTGFVVWLSPTGPQLSRQLDIIIYDAIGSGPLVRLQTCDVFPLEAVFGYVEVRATLRSSSDGAEAAADDSIEACVSRNLAVRRMNERSFWVPTGTSPATVALVRSPWLSLRSYLVAFEAAGSVATRLDALADRLGTLLKRAGVPAHFHGVLIPNHGLLYTRPVDRGVAAEDDYFHVKYTADHALLNFRTCLLRDLATFQRPAQDWAAAIDEYLKHVAEWHERSPLT
jgi:hypothetical protein